MPSAESRSVYWMWPEGATKFHAFINGQGVSACRYHHYDDVRPCPRTRDPKNCTRCERTLEQARG